MVPIDTSDLHTKMNGWGGAPQNPFSTIFVDVQLIQKDNRCNTSYIAHPQWWKKIYIQADI
jgi:hypothetical protein